MIIFIFKNSQLRISKDSKPSRKNCGPFKKNSGEIPDKLFTVSLINPESPELIRSEYSEQLRESSLL
jgi:hypothetical protein